jgi:hypothetical protein
MTNTRDSSITLCKNIVPKLIKRNKDIKLISMEIKNVLENEVTIEIKIDDNVRTVNVPLEKTKRVVNEKSKKNLKNQKIENIILTNEKELIDLEINNSNNIEVCIEDDLDKKKELKNIIFKNENDINKKSTCSENMEKKEIEIVSNSVIQENIENKENNSILSDDYEDDPYIMMYDLDPDDVKELCDELDELKIENKDLKKENIEIKKKYEKNRKTVNNIISIMNNNPNCDVYEHSDNQLEDVRKYLDNNLDTFCNIYKSKLEFTNETEIILKNKNKLNNTELKNLLKIYTNYNNEFKKNEKDYRDNVDKYDVLKRFRSILDLLFSKEKIIQEISEMDLNNIN